MTATTPDQSESAAGVVSSSAQTEDRNSWTPTDRLIGTWVAWSLFALGLTYVAVMALGFLAAGGLDGSPLADPVFAIMELLILVQTPLIVVLFGILHRYAAPSVRSFSLAALVFVAIMACITMSVHFVLLTVGRVPPSQLPGFDRLFSFNWPSVVYALDILAWDYCFGLALLLAALIFRGGPAERAVRTGMLLAGILCLAGLLGVLTANMQIRNIGIAGYGVVFPVVTLLMTRVFRDERSCTATNYCRT